MDIIRGTKKKNKKPQNKSTKVKFKTDNPHIVIDKDGNEIDINGYFNAEGARKYKEIERQIMNSNLGRKPIYDEVMANFPKDLFFFLTFSEIEKIYHVKLNEVPPKSNSFKHS
ncbi:hypothetical protein HN800_01600 [bacterium]|jgi:hypothetical protein|nr:hypothetical protein [bacterium]MBT4495318.1 hypothetical protein [bacterium]MBT4763764.1 hypothetical protein [bacterium]MBT5401134.1 hypothetical protein [bacterium]MBT5942906.1 hypothetical protein [bacterium]